MPKKKKNIVELGTEIARAVEYLTELGYSYLEDSDFSIKKTVEQTMMSKPYRCYWMSSAKINRTTMDVLYACDPIGKVFCVFKFDSDGLSEKTSVTVGKITYHGQKALSVIKTNLK